MYVTTFCAVVLAHSMGSLPDDEAALYRMMQDRITENEARLRHGQFRFYVERKYRSNPHPVKLQGTVVWDGEKAFWIYSISDPDKIIKPTFAWASDLNAARTEYMIKQNLEMMMYNGSSNSIHVNKWDKDAKLTGLELYDVLPASNWYVCYAPAQETGSPWRRMIGPSSPGMAADSTMSIRESSGNIVQTRIDRSGEHTFQITFNMAMRGNVSSFESVEKSTGLHRKGEYDWELRGDYCILRNYRYTETDKGGNIRSYYVLKVSEFDEKKPQNSNFSFEALKGLVPQDVVVVNHINNKVYHANKVVGISEETFDKLSKTLVDGNVFRK